MKFRAVYGVLLIGGLILAVTFGYFRRNEAEAPGWLYAVALVVVPLCIWVDVKSRRDKKRQSN